MAVDIIAINPANPINCKYAVCSAMPTGQYSTLLVNKKCPTPITIADIESKYDDSFIPDILEFIVDGGEV